MRNTVYSYIDRFRHDRHQRLVLGSVLLILAVIVSVSVYWQLRYVGITMTNETYCGYEEHVHTDDCYEYTLICELEESEGHAHTDECYEEQQVLICELEESEGHTHSESCYDEEGNLICGLEESEGHAHTAECYETQTVLICELEESEGHTHTDDCYEKTLICELEEHTHTVECLIDLNADVEDATVWEATLPELTGDLRTDVVAIAYSQLGYTESTANYSIGEDEVTHYGYTRYGEWYGSVYADWDSVFVAFCLDYAGIEDEFTYNAGAYAWSVDLTNLGYYQSADSYSPSTGDIVFIDTDDDGRANVSAIATSVGETSITVIQGNYSVTDSEGNTTDRVAYVTYSTVVDVTGSELTTLSSGSETETVEITPVILGYANISPEEASEVVVEETEDEPTVDETEADETDGTDGTEEVAEEVALEDDSTDSSEETVEEEETEEEETLLLTATSNDYVTQVTELYTLGMSLTAGDTSTAATIWDTLMTIWEQIYAEEEAGTLTLTAEEYDNVNALTDEVYYYFVYDPYGVMTISTTYDASAIYKTDGTVLSTNSVTWEASNVSYDDGSFTLELFTNFTITGEDIQPTGTGTDIQYATYYIYLPDGVTVDSSILDQQYTGTNSSGTENTFHYYYEYDDASGQYYIKIVYDIESYYTGKTGELNGKIDYTNYSISAEDVTPGTGTVTIAYGSGYDIVIPTSEIEREENESWLQDLTISKSSQSYDLDSNSITYTIYITSTSGTGVITLEDVMSVVTNQSYSGSLTVESIEVNSVEYQKSIYYSNEYGSWTSWTTVSTSTEQSTDAITESSTPGSFTYTTSDPETDITITLAPLVGGDGGTISGTSTTSDRYVVTYTVTFTEGSSTIDASVINEATATSTIDEDTITDEATSTRRVSTSTVDKNHQYDSDSGRITWTITFNANRANIAGYTLTDDMLSQLLDGTLQITAADSNGDAVTAESDKDYTINYDNNGKITGITFNAISDPNNTGTNDTNDWTYTIVYETDTGLGMGDTGGWVYNEVDIYKGETLVDEDEDSVWTYSSGSIAKSVSAASDTGTATLNGIDITTRVLTWTSTLTVPSSGIDAGSTITDYLGSSWTYTNLSTIKQWFTYDQLKVLLDTLTDSTTGAITFTNSSTSVETSYKYSDGYYTVEVYDVNDGQWYEYPTTTLDQSHLFTAWRITLLKDIEVDGKGTISFTYASTANISDIETTRDYTNYIHVNGDNLYASATYTERNKVYKTDGSGNHSLTNVTTSTGTGTVTWKVYVNADGLTSYDGDITITDTLPDGVTLDSVYIALGYSGYSVTLTATTDNNGTTLSSGYLYGVLIEGTVTDNADGTSTVTITIPYVAYSILTSNSSNPYITLTYTTTIDDWGEDDEFDTTEHSDASYDDSTNTYSRVYKLNNSVVVKIGTTEYEDSQEQDITHTKKGETTSYTHDAVEKSGNYSTLSGSNNSNLVDYEVVLNLDGKDLLDGGDTLTFTDVVSTYSNLSWGGTAVYATLIYNSVKFYKLYKLTETTYESTGTTYTYVYTDDNDVEVTLYTGSSDITYWSNYSNFVYAYTETDGNITYYYMAEMDIEWDYAYDDSQSWNITHTLTADVPDETPILVKYTYRISAENVGSNSIYVGNSASLTGEYTPIDDDGDYYSGTYDDPQTSGTMADAGGLTVYKTGAHTSTTVEDVTFELYMYDSSESEWVQVTYNGTPVTYTTDGSGYISVVPYYYADANSSTKTYYGWYYPNTLYYLVEKSGPTNYVIDTETKYYFYWYDSTSTNYPYSTMSDRYPSTWDYTTSVRAVTEESNTTIYISNQPITTFTLTKVSSSDSSTTIAGAVFGLYRWSGSRNAWVKIGTYATDASGKITITYDDDTFDYNHAYKITEETTAEGYNIAWEDVTEFYFYWSSDDDGGEVVGPDGWAAGDDGKTIYTALDLTDGSKTVYATNSPTASTIAVKKIWIDENGEIITDTTGYSSTVQLYYYVGDANGTPVRITTSTSTSTVDLITLTTTTGVAADTEVVFASGTSMTDASSGNVTTTVSTSYSKLTLSSRADVISAIIDDAYTDGYLKVTVQNSSDTGSLRTFIEGTYTDTNGKTSYPTLTSYLSPADVETDGSTSVVYFSLSELRSALESSSYVQDYMTRYGYTAEQAVTALWNSIDLITTNGNDNNITLSSFEFVGSAKTVKTTASTWSLDVTGDYGKWTWVLSSDTELANALQTDGAKIVVTYTCSSIDNTSDSKIVVGLRSANGTSNEVNSESYVTVSSTSSTEVTISVDPTGGTNYSNLDFSDLSCVYINTAGFTGTITSVSVVIPSSSESITRSYTYEKTEEVNTTLTSSWIRLFDRTDDIVSALETDGAVIYITYTCVDTAPTNAAVGIQYSCNYYNDYDWYNISSMFSVGSGYLAIPVSNILSGKYSLDDYNVIFLYDYSGSTVTITSASILVPYTVTESISGVISSGTYSITLYEPTFPNKVSIANDEQTGQWNAITSKETEPTYNYVNVDSTVNTTLITGYALLDAIYADLASTIEITLDVKTATSLNSSDVIAELKTLSFIIQGDKSVGNTDDGYVAIGSVTPEKVTYNESDGTYTIVYSTDKIISSLKSFNNAYVDAASVFADYNAICLSLGYNDSTFTADVTGLKVVSQQFNTADFYTYSSLIGYDYGILYTDDANPDGYTFVLNDYNDWTVAVSNLPLTYTYTYTDSQTGETVTETLYRYYYFVETSHTGGSVVYTTTYSQREGENGGGEIVISNIATTFVLPTTGWSGNYQTLYEFGILLILLALSGAGAYWNISRIRKSLVSEPLQVKVNPDGHDERLPDVRNRRFVIPRNARKGDTRAGPDDDG